MHDRLPIHHPLASATDPSGSFAWELRDLVRKRTRLMLMIATGVVLTLVAVDFLIAEPRGGLQGGLAPLRMELRLVHLVTFAAATLLTHVLEGGTTRQFQLLAFWVLAFNLVVAIFLNASVTPAEEPYFASAIGLFIFAVRLFKPEQIEED